MNLKRKLIIALSLLFCAIAALGSEKLALDLYHQANIAYQKQDYSTAIRNYEQLIKLNHISADVYYNLGNAWFKSGNVPKAILNYERAKKLSPDDEDISFNLKIASLKVVDKIEAVPQVFYVRWTNSIASAMPGNSWSTVFVISIWLAVGAIAGFFLFRLPVFKKISFILAIVLGGLSVMFYTLASRSYTISYKEKQAIVMEPSVYVKSEPDQKGNDLFILHEGTRVDVIEQLNNWNKIRIPNGTIGWMKQSELEII